MKTKILLASLMVCFLHAAFGQTELITDGGFESNGSGWQFSPGAVVVNNAIVAHTGVNYLAMGRVNGAGQTAFQTVTIPANTVAATLTFYYNIYSTDTINPSEDFLQVVVANTNGTGAMFVLNASVANNNDLGPGNPYYHQQTFGLKNFAGQTINITFYAQTASTFGNLTAFNIDDVSVVVETTADIPANDNFAARTALTGTNTAAIGKNVFATKEPGEPNHAGGQGGKSLWWSWTAPALGTVTINTDNSSFATLLAVYTGSSERNLTRVVSDPAQVNLHGANQGKLNVIPGTEYEMEVT